MNPYKLIIELLKTHDVEFDETEHQPVYTSEEAAKVRGFSLDAGAKSLLLKADNDFVLVVLPGSRKMNSKKLRQALGKKNIRFADPAQVSQHMGCEIGACYPFGSVAGLKTYLDRALLSQPVISFNPGVHNKSLKMKLKDYLALEKPLQVDVSQE